MFYSGGASLAARLEITAGEGHNTAGDHGATAIFISPRDVNNKNCRGGGYRLVLQGEFIFS